ncbi:MAG: type I-G CRISPR-associated protein Csb2 [Caulobacterales bacterium]
MPLVLEIEHLLGIAFAAIGPDTPEPDWPPQPDRVFSALVAAWAARGKCAEERAALEWLETQPPPKLAYAAMTARPAPASFVPPNDKVKITASPGWRSRQPRRFPAALPEDPTVRLVWESAGEGPVDTLDAIARDVAYVGHSASLTRCRFQRADDAPEGLQRARRRVYNGRLAQLEVAFEAKRRPSPGDPVREPPPEPPKTSNTFGRDWLTLEIAEGVLDLRAAPLAAKTLLKAVMSGYGRAGFALPEWVSGHRPDGAPSAEPHLAVAPLAFVGWEHGDGQLLGFALVPPAGRCAFEHDADFRRALFAVTEHADGRRLIELGGTNLKLAITLDADKASLDPRRYLRSARVWATATPLVLPRHMKNGGPDQVAELIADACAHIGLPRPVRAIAHKHAAITGAPSARPSAGAPRWTGWRVPEQLASRPLTHAVVEFAEPVTGPVLIGAGRFCGLGLCLPMDPVSQS